MTRGYFAKDYAHGKIWLSEPQIPARFALIFTRTSPADGVGISRSIDNRQLIRVFQLKCFHYLTPYQFHSVPSSRRDWQISRFIGIFRRQLFIEFDAKTQFVSRMRIAVIESPVVREDFEHLFGITMYSRYRNWGPTDQRQRCSHADW